MKSAVDNVLNKIMVTVTRKKFTIDEYHKLLDLGFFTENDRIELIRGEIIEMAPKRTPHSVCNSLLWKQLYELIGKQAEIRVQEPIILREHPTFTVSKNA